MPSPLTFFALAHCLTRFVPARKRPLAHARGQGLVEYALVIALIAVVVIGALMLISPAINAKLTEIINALQRGIGPAPTATPRRK